MSELNAPICDGILHAIGRTPLVRLRRHLDLGRGRLYAKLESFNPGGSAKDRPAAEMVARALAEGTINSASTIIESSSGNMGVGLAQACRYHGLRLICVVDCRIQPQNLAILQALGAEVDIVTRPVAGDLLRARLARVCQLLESIPNSFWPNQYANAANPQAHDRGTVREIDEALDGDFDYLFVATSSTGTIRGCQDYLHRHGRRAKLVAVDAVGSVLFDGAAGKRLLPGLGAGRLPALARGHTYDKVCRVRDLECVVECRRLADREAMLVGGSSGGVLAAMRQMRDHVQNNVCVAILHDSGTRYLDTVFSDQWVAEHFNLTAQQMAELVHSDYPCTGGVSAACPRSA